jgi:iron complex transport system ATP-binding protein
MAGPDRSTERGATFEVRGLSFAYDGLEAVQGIDLRVEPGEIVGLLGPNGSGKSTVIKMLSGVLGGYGGSARLDGEEIADTPRRALARKLAVVPQEPSFGFPFSALEIALMGRHPHLAGLAFESERDIELARLALERCGAAEFALRSIQELSSGERQRVVFARALAQQPRMLLLDEPASFLDIRHQVEIYDIVRGLVGEDGCSVLTVMHDLNLAAEYCDRIYLLRRGKVEATGPTAEVLTYANLTRVFDTEVYVDTNTLTGKLIVVPLSGRVQERLRDNEPDS